MICIKFELSLLHFKTKYMVGPIPHRPPVGLIYRVVDPDPEPEPDPYWIRIQSGLWIRIRIRNPDPDPGGQK